MRKRPLQLLYSYLGVLFKFAGLKAIKAGGLLFLSGLFRGVSLLMLIPLLGLTGLGDTTGTPDSISVAVESMMTRLHISYSLAGVLAFFLLLVVAEAFFTRYQSIALNALNLDFTQYLRKTLYRRISSASWHYHSRTHSAESMHLLDNAVQKISSSTFYVLQLFVLIFQAIVYFFVASSISWPMTLVMLLTGLMLYVLLIPLNKRMYRHGEKAVNTSQTLYRNMVDFFSGLKLAKSYNRTRQHIDEFIRTGQHLLNNEKAVIAASASAQMWLRIFSVSLLCIFVYIAFSTMHMEIEQVLVLIVIVNRLYGVFSSAQSFWQGLLQTLPSYATYQKAMQNFQQHAEPAQNTQILIPPLKSQLRLEHISFQYQAHSTIPGLADFSATFPANKTTAITGPSGVGKSTLADILMGLLIPDSGTIYVDNTALTPDLLFSWRNRIAYVPQEAYLFDGSIRSNLQWSDDEEFNDQQIWVALDAAAASDFVRKIPEQLDTMVGERGVKLSGGERQRIALARALLKKPDMLILDEATSSLDQKTEINILDALNILHGRMTIIIIAHSERTIAHADFIIPLSSKS